MKFMLTFPLNHRAYKERVSRFLESGAPSPEGMTILGRWFTASHNKGFVLVETERASLLFQYVSEWADIVDFEIDPVVTDEEAAPILQNLGLG